MSEQRSTPAKAPSLPGIARAWLNNLPEPLRAGLNERRDALEAFTQDPKNVETWLHVTDMALLEEQQGFGQPEELQDIPAASLVNLAQFVLAAEPKDRYSLMARQAPNGKL